MPSNDCNCQVITINDVGVKVCSVAPSVHTAYEAGVAAERKRMIDELEDAATDCDGHTPYSILMALAREAREAQDA